jgi:signal peptidase I
MLPNLVSGQRLIINSQAYVSQNPNRGDIVVFPNPKNDTVDFIKRIIGLPGEYISLKDSNIFVNNRLLEESYLKKIYPPITFEPRQWILEENQYIVLGDNRLCSDDSRNFWPIQKEAIKGKAWLRVWPPQNWGVI